MVISSSHDADIERALIRARARGLKLRRVERISDGANVVVRYRANSHSHPGTEHMVSIEYSAHGVSVYCDCLGAQHGRVCCHTSAALALENMVDLPDGWVEEIAATQTPTVEPMSEPPTINDVWADWMEHSFDPEPTPRLTLADFRRREAEADAYWG